MKEVLCVVLVEIPKTMEDTQSDEEYIASLESIRGVNVEVSLPTGTVYAECNAISTAFCKFPKLERKDIKAVAVLSLDRKLSKLGPCGACQEWLKKVLEVNPDLRVISFNNPQTKEVFVRPALLI